MKSRLLICLVLLLLGGCKYMSVTSRDSGASLPGAPYLEGPHNARLLCEVGELALFAGETPADTDYRMDLVKRYGADRVSPECRNSLFMRRLANNGKYDWRLLMTTGGNWQEDISMRDRCMGSASDVRGCFKVLSASLSKDGHAIWMVCDPDIGTYYLVCRYDLNKNTFAVLIDGCSAEEQADGTILVGGVKTYLSDENGEPLGAAWYDAWITPEGKIVRKGKPVQYQ